MVEISELTRQNPWWVAKNSVEEDTRILDFERSSVKWIPRLKKYLALDKDAVYSLRGPRQVGKTTLIKLIIREELQKRKNTDIFYFTCDLVNSPLILKDLLESYHSWAQSQSTGRKLICLDEISQVKNWETAIKFFIDVYSLEKKTFILTGSSSFDLKHAVERLPGRKGELNVEQNHKVLLPMKFAEYVELRNPAAYAAVKQLGLAENEIRKKAFLEVIEGNYAKWITPLLPFQERFNALFDEYLLTGGVMSAVNQYVSHQEIRNTVYELYLQFFFGDLARLMREETTAKKILSSVIKHKGKPIGWTQISKETGIPSQLTVTQYCDILKNSFALNVYSALDLNRLTPKHRSDKKLQIPNPFFFHAFRSYVENPAGNYFRSAQQFVQTPEGKALLAEYVCGDHLSRLAYDFAPSDLFDQSASVFYAKNRKGETVDFMVRLGESFLPVEVKYQNQINAEDYRGLRNFKKGVLATKNTNNYADDYAVISLPLLLLFI